jgi:hypothetical protein
MLALAVLDSWYSSLDDGSTQSTYHLQTLSLASHGMANVGDLIRDVPYYEVAQTCKLKLPGVRINKGSSKNTVNACC